MGAKHPPNVTCMIPKKRVKLLVSFIITQRCSQKLVIQIHVKMHKWVPVKIWDCLKHIQSQTDYQQQPEPQIYNTVLQAGLNNQEVCHVTKNPLNLSLLVFSEDDYCLCLWRWIVQATHECASSLYLMQSDGSAGRHHLVVGYITAAQNRHVTSIGQSVSSVMRGRAVSMTGACLRFQEEHFGFEF